MLASLIVLLAPVVGLAAEPDSAPESTTEAERILVDVLEQSTTLLAERDEQAHYVALALTDLEEVELTARSGTIAASSRDHERYLDVDVRVGTPELDSTHPLRGFSSLEADDRWQVRVPLVDGPALRHAVWTELDARYRKAAERIVIIRANRAVKIEEEDPSPDFEPRAPVVDRHEIPELVVDVEAWEAILAEVSEHLEASPVVHRASAQLTGERVVKTFVDTEGTRLVHGRTHVRLSLSAQTTAEDGDRIAVHESIDLHGTDGLPGREELIALADAEVEELVALAEAPRGTPYSGPVVLAGRAAAVFFHEVFGHRVEGHRQKSEDEGKTFAEQVGRPILPDFIDVYDDPTLSRMAGVDLNGHYAYDDEGVPAARAVLVEDGVFTGFLMGRSPIARYPSSNGHGRRSVGNAPTSRMGNTIIEARDPVDQATLRQMLLHEIRALDLDYGYIVDEIDGGFTQTGRVTPNAFNVRATATWRVHADGRPDELVRGIDLVGTPLVAFGTLMAASEEVEVFNGTCGAESGWVPVSAVAPSLLFQNLEFQLKERGQERPPLLPRPDVADGATMTGEEVVR